MKKYSLQPWVTKFQTNLIIILNMDNSFILKISLSVAMLGIIGLYVFTSISENTMEVAKIQDFLGERVSVEGTVEKYYTSKDGHVFFDIYDFSGSVSAVAFRNSNIEEAYKIKDGDQIKITGKVQEYKNELEIIISQIDV